jgi:glycosyl transferase family 9 (putative heptosyltransferase)
MLDTARVPDSGVVSMDPLKIYTGILGQIGDIVVFTPTVRRIKQLFPNSRITWAVSSRYREAGELVGGLPYVDRLFVTELYFEKLVGAAYGPWHMGWPVDLRGDDEVEEQRRHDIVLETRPFPRRPDFWNYGHAVDAYAYCAGVPGPIERRTEVCIPHGTIVPPDARGRIVFHNDPLISEAKAWPWHHAGEFIRGIAPEPVVLLGGPGEPVPGALDYRGLTTLVQAAAIIAAAKCYVGVESGLLHIAGALQVPMVGLFGTSYVPAYSALYPDNPHGIWLQAEGALEGIRPETVLQAVAQILRRGGVVGGS